MKNRRSQKKNFMTACRRLPESMKVNQNDSILQDDRLWSINTYLSWTLKVLSALFKNFRYSTPIFKSKCTSDTELLSLFKSYTNDFNLFCFVMTLMRLSQKDYSDSSIQKGAISTVFTRKILSFKTTWFITNKYFLILKFLLTD